MPLPVCADETDEIGAAVVPLPVCVVPVPDDDDEEEEELAHAVVVLVSLCPFTGEVHAVVVPVGVVVLISGP